MREFAADERELSTDATLDKFFDAASADSLSAAQAAFKRSVTNMRVAGETRPQLAFQAWVGKNQERRGG
jgi:hypothetical protein